MKVRRTWGGFGIAAATLLVAGCTAVPKAEAPPPAPKPTPAPTPPPPAPAKSWEDRALTAGAWRYDAGSRTASFVQSGSPDPLLALACSGGSIRLTSGLDGNVALHTSAGADQIRFDGGSASIPSRDARLDRIAFSRGRFALEGTTGALTLPVQSEIGRAIEDCRG